MATRQEGRRRLDSSVPDEYDVPTRSPRIASPERAHLVMLLIGVLWAAGTIGAATAVIAVDVPSWISRPSAALLLVVFTTALVHRAGGHMRLWVSAAVLLGGLAASTQSAVLLAAAAVATAVTAAVWSVLLSRPADSIRGILVEYAMVMVAALSGTFAVAAWNADVNYQRFNLLVVSIALGVTIAVIGQLGAGLHGLGRQHLLILVGVAVLLLILLAYSSFVRSHGSQSLVNLLSDLIVWSRDTFGGIPRPIEVLLGFPALVVGISMRAQRREGWWPMMFAVVGTAVLNTSLVTPSAFPSYVLTSAAYSIVLGLLVGLVVRSRLLTERSARAARQFEPASRVEPGRFAPLK